MEHHSNKFMANYQNLHKNMEKNKHVSGRELSEERKIRLSTSQDEMDRRMRNVWDFITGRNTSILDK